MVSFNSCENEEGYPLSPQRSWRLGLIFLILMNYLMVLLNNNFILEGKIDLILSNQNHYVIIDYKTNDSENFSPDLIKHGFSLQLPIYYLLTKEHIFLTFG